MASLAISSCSNSFQLQLGFKCRQASLIFIRTQVRTVNRRVHLRAASAAAAGSAAREGDGEEEKKKKKSSEDSWMSSDASGDGFSGWFGTDSGGSQGRRGLGGIVGTALAGVILVAGLVVTSFSIRKRNASGPKQYMEPLTSQQEVLLLSDDQKDTPKQVGSDKNTIGLDEECLQNDHENETALQVHPGKVVVPAVIDQVLGQALAALQVLKVIEADVQPSDICTRREYARWLVSASGALSRNSVSKVYPAMYIENVTELAFDDITPEDPDFASIQGLAEAGLIASKLSRRDLLESSDGNQGPFLFFPGSPLSRQDLVSWKMAVEKRQLPEVDRKIIYQSCGFIDIDRINPDAWPAIVADHSAGEQGIMALAFGYTRLFQPDKPVTKAQAAIAIATGEAADVVNEELARIEAESAAEAAVAAHTALIAEVEKDINASFEKELAIEREKIETIEKMAQEARQELERLRAEREEQNNSLIRERAAVESEMGVLSRLRRDVEEQLQSLMSDKMQISFEKERINKLRNEAESENREIARLQYELEVERKALAMARSWAEDEAKRAREQAKCLEEARERWESRGIKVVVDSDLQEDATAGVTWLNAGNKPQSLLDEAVIRAKSLVDKLKVMASEIRGTSKIVIERIILLVTCVISELKEKAAEVARKAGELKGAAVSRASESVEQLQQKATGFGLSLKDGAKRIADDCREGVGKISQKFKGYYQLRWWNQKLRRTP